MKTPTLAGGLDIFGPVHLLRMLQDTRATGRLELMRHDERVNLFFERGRSVYCRSSGGSLHLGDVLVSRGELRSEVIDLALAVQSDEPGKRIGRILVERGSVTEPQVREAVRAVQQQILLDVLIWREGTFQFHAGESAPEGEIHIDMDVDRLMLGLLQFASAVLQRRSDREAA